MVELAPFKAFLTKDRSAVLMVRGAWRQRVAASDLRGWAAFYRRLWSRVPKGSGDPKKPGPWARFYEEPVRVLESLIETMEKPNG